MMPSAICSSLTSMHFVSALTPPPSGSTGIATVPLHFYGHSTMKLSNALLRVRIASFATAGALSLAAATSVNAEAVKTVNGTEIDSAVLDVYMQNRINKPLEQVTAEEREALISELTDIYLLSTQDL